MATIKKHRVGFHSVGNSIRPKVKSASQTPPAKKQESRDSLMSTDEYIEYLRRDVQKLEISALAASTPEKRKEFEAKKAKRADLLQKVVQWFGKDKRGAEKATIEARAFRSDGSLIEPEIVH